MVICVICVICGSALNSSTEDARKTLEQKPKLQKPILSSTDDADYTDEQITNFRLQNPNPKLGTRNQKLETRNRFSHSHLNAMIGSTLAARRAGR